MTGGLTFPDESYLLPRTQKPRAWCQLARGF
jgi:hypothetical protein